MSEEPEAITPDTTVLEVLQRHRQTEAVFRRYDTETGACLLCHALFNTLAETAEKYELNLEHLLGALRAAVREEQAGA